MTIKVLANKTLYFDRGEKDKHGQLVRVKTKVGDFCELPEWVGETDYFKAAIKDKSLQAFNSSSESGVNERLFEEKQALIDEIRQLKEDKDLMSGKQSAKKEEKEPKSKEKVSVTLNAPAYSKEGDTKHDIPDSAPMPVIFNDVRAGSDKLEDSLEIEVPVKTPKRR
jgi:hypothetical protein